MLGSDQDGEALGAARAMARVLGGAGSGFHDLAELIESDPSADSLQGRARSPFHASQWYPKGHPDQEWSYTPPPPPHRPAAFFVGGGWKYANQKTGPQAIADFLTIGGISVSPADIEFLRWVERRLWSEPHKSLDAIDLRRLGKIWKSNADLIEADASADRAAA
ncbi:MAG: hypothetical protein WDN69_05130 [Aliidongia sp.]